MPNRLNNIDTIIVNLEERGGQFLETLLDGGQFEIEVGKMKVLAAENGRAYFLQKTNGLPVWFDVTLTSVSDPTLETGMDFLVFDYEQEYADVRQRQLEAARTQQPLDMTDALEALVLAELAKDTAVAESLIFRLTGQLPEVIDLVLPRLGRGNTRLRSAFGRLVALSGRPDATEALLDYLADEAAQGVRADIIMTFVQAAAARADIPQPILRRFLRDMELTDALSAVMALAAVDADAPASLLNDAADKYRPALAGWLTQG